MSASFSPRSSRCFTSAGVISRLSIKPVYPLGSMVH
jgi:hypothetical protein